MPAEPNSVLQVVYFRAGLLGGKEGGNESCVHPALASDEDWDDKSPVFTNRAWPPYPVTLTHHAPSFEVLAPSFERIVGIPDRGTGIGCSRGAFYEWRVILPQVPCVHHAGLGRMKQRAANAVGNRVSSRDHPAVVSADGNPGLLFRLSAARCSQSILRYRRFAFEEWRLQRKSTGIAHRSGREVYPFARRM